MSSSFFFPSLLLTPRRQWGVPLPSCSLIGWRWAGGGRTAWAPSAPPACNLPASAGGWCEAPAGRAGWWAGPPTPRPAAGSAPHAGCSPHASPFLQGEGRGLVRSQPSNSSWFEWLSARHKILCLTLHILTRGGRKKTRFSYKARFLRQAILKSCWGKNYTVISKCCILISKLYFSSFFI